MPPLLRIPILLLVFSVSATAGVADHRLVVTGRVVDELGRPVGGAEVRLRNSRDLYNLHLEGALSTTRTSADGEFRLVDPSLDRNFCACCCDAYVDARIGTSRAISGGFPRARGAIALRDLTLSEPFVLEGRLADREGRPVSRAVLTMDVRGLGDGEEPGLPQGCSPRVVATDSRGEFRCDPLPVRPGWTATIYVEHPDHVFEEVEIRDLPSRPRLDLTLSRGLTVRGRALDADGRPADGIDLYCGGRKGRTGKDGSFEVRGVPLRGGWVTLGRIRVPPHEEEAVVDLGDVVRIPEDPEEPAPFSIRGTVFGLDGRALRDIDVRARGVLHGEYLGRERTDREGCFDIGLESAAPCRLSASTELTFGRLEAELPADPISEPVEIRFPTTGVLRLVIENRPPAGLEIEVDGESVGVSGDPVGDPRLKLSEGSHHLRIIPFGRPVLELDVEVVPTDPERVIPITLPR